MDYIAKAKKLTKTERERVLSRMDGKLPKQLKKEKLTEDKAIALQLEIEDEQLQEWREKMAAIRAKELKTKEKTKVAEKVAKNTKPLGKAKPTPK